MDSPQTQQPLPPVPRHHSSIPPSATSPIQIHRRPSLQRPSSPGSSRRPPHRPVRQPNEIVLPEWQPDSSAVRCPICHGGFTFWNRRHHCRKCGRVVCHACSPHRIIIPKAFVVHPPPLSCYPPAAPTPTPTPTPTPHRSPHRASWGPDSGALLRRASSSGDEDDGLQVRICDDCLGRRSPGETQPYNASPGRSVPHPHRYPYAPAPIPYYSSSSLPYRRPQGQYYYPVPGSSRRELPAQFRAPRLKETDYCPICTLALPPVDPVTGSEEERERHVQLCISNVEGAGSVGSRGGTPGSVGGMAEMRGRRYTGGARMVVWKAKEKDTWIAGEEEEGEGEGEKGKREKAECVICFEEFEEGDVIARLECLCRYHKKCIREWFDRKGNGECPIHAVHD